MKIGIIGSRKFRDIIAVDTILELELMPKFHNNLTIISGGASGIDNHVKSLCKTHGVPLIEYKPDFTNCYNVKQYHLRNDKIIEEADRVIAFWDGDSKGTKSVIQKCLERKKT